MAKTVVMGIIFGHVIDIAGKNSTFMVKIQHVKSSFSKPN